MVCLKCDEVLQRREASLPGEFREEKCTVRMTALVCPKCDYRTLGGKDMPEYMRLVADEYRKRHGLLTSDEIRQRRKQLRMTQEAFAEYLKVGVASVRRWELGLVQDESMNQLIEVMTSPDFVARHMKQLARRIAARQPSGAHKPAHASVLHKQPRGTRALR